MEIINKVLKSKEFKFFQAAFKADRLSHAYFVHGEDAKSNHAFLKALALNLVCHNHTICGNCAGCKKIEAGFHPDVLVYPKGKNFVVSDSENIIENASIKPLESAFKVFVIQNFDNATVQAQNKLLKVIEEAPKNVVFLFDAVFAENVLQTIKSRSQEIQIPSFQAVCLEKEEDYTFLFEMVLNLNSTKQTLLYAPRFAEKTGFLKRLEVLATIYEKLLKQKVALEDNGLKAIESSYQLGAISEIIEAITLAKQQFLANVSTNLIADSLLIKILEVRYKWNNV